MNFLGNMYLVILLKVTKIRAAPSFQKTQFQENHRRVKLTPSLFRVKLDISNVQYILNWKILDMLKSLLSITEVTFLIFVHADCNIH